MIKKLTFVGVERRKCGLEARSGKWEVLQIADFKEPRNGLDEEVSKGL
jgi:hypothetical protein